MSAVPISSSDTSPELQSWVRLVDDEIRRRPANLQALRVALEALLVFLSSSAGRTDVNVRWIDMHFSVDYDWDADWGYLPPDVQEILADMGGALHDTLRAPEVAANFHSTPEQLLERVRALPR